MQFTPSARSQLLELVVRLRQRDRNRAAVLIDDLEQRLQALAAGRESHDERRQAARLRDDSGNISLWYWHRRGIIWVLAIGLSDVDMADHSLPRWGADGGNDALHDGDSD